MKNIELENRTIRCNRKGCDYSGKSEIYHAYIQCPKCSTTDVTITNQTISKE